MAQISSRLAKTKNLTFWSLVIKNATKLKVVKVNQEGSWKIITIKTLLINLNLITCKNNEKSYWTWIIA